MEDGVLSYRMPASYCLINLFMVRPLFQEINYLVQLIFLSLLLRFGAETEKPAWTLWASRLRILASFHVCVYGGNIDKQEGPCEIE
jgi:hypothetical protein